MLAVATIRKNLIPCLMAKRGMSTYALSRKMDMPWHNVNKIVQAPTIPEGTAYKTLVKLARALDVGIDDLEQEIEE